MVEKLADRETVLVDGIKVLEDSGWVLVLPDPEEPVTHIWAEGVSDEDADERADRYRSMILDLLA
jgi:mannose-1-phosphate guanylyltransferase / phosphomannomutase